MSRLTTFQEKGRKVRPPGFHTTAREPKRAHLRAPALETPPKFHERTPRETQKERNGGGRGKTKSEILGGPAFGPPPFEPQRSGAPPFGPPLLQAPPFGPPPFGRRPSTTPPRAGKIVGTAHLNNFFHGEPHASAERAPQEMRNARVRKTVSKSTSSKESCPDLCRTFARSTRNNFGNKHVFLNIELGDHRITVPENLPTHRHWTAENSWMSVVCHNLVFNKIRVDGSVGTNNSCRLADQLQPTPWALPL